MKSKAILLFALLLCISSAAAQQSLSGPDGRLVLTVSEDAKYSISYDGAAMLEPSALGLRTNRADYSFLALKGAETGTIDETYSLPTGKRSLVHYLANSLVCTFENPEGQMLKVEFRVSDSDVALRYLLDGCQSVRVLEELTAFNLPSRSTTFLTPQSDAMVGWKRTKPSYEEFYAIDRPLGEASEFGHGFTFPCLFKVGGDGWVLLGETGVDSRYCASRLSDWQEGGYRIAFPMAEENDGNGTPEPAFACPGATPWRTVTVGADLGPIAETTVTWDVVKPLYEPSYEYIYGKGTWSWILWQDGSINYDDQVRYIDLAAAMGFSYVLVDNFWDRTIGRERMEELVKYAHSQGVDVFLWYSSSGYWNDIEQSPVNCMDSPIARKAEMRWLQRIGVKGIKVDFFGGDKQETLRIYEGVLSDADDHGLMVIFHGCTIPRGWERMYPNYVGSEAVRASENLVFGQAECDIEAQNATLHPFIRNSLGCMEFGGCFLNKVLSKNQSKGSVRRMSDEAELATAVLFQNPIQNFALAPNNLEDAPEHCLEFLREVPTTWDDIRYIDGYPGKYAVIARRSGGVWYVGALNADKDVAYQLDLKEIMSKLGGSSLEVLHAGARTEVTLNQKAKKGSKAYARDNVVTLPGDDGAVVIVSE